MPRVKTNYERRRREADFRLACTQITPLRRIRWTTTVTPTSVSHSILLWHHTRAAEECSVNLLSGNSRPTSMEIRSKVVVGSRWRSSSLVGLNDSHTWRKLFDRIFTYCDYNTLLLFWFLSSIINSKTNFQEKF